MTRKEIVKTVIDAFMARDPEGALAHMTDDIVMEWPGAFALEPGRDAVREFFKRIPEITGCTIDAIIEEGPVVAGRGSMAWKEVDGSPGRAFFCDVYTFSNLQVKRISSYVVFEKQAAGDPSASPG